MPNQQILIVDKDEISNFITTRIIRQTGFKGEIATASSCDMAESHVKDYYKRDGSCPALVLVEVTLFEDKFLKFISEFNCINHSNKRVPLVIMGNFSAKDKLNISQLGIDIFVTKPLTVEKVNHVKTRLLQNIVA